MKQFFIEDTKISSLLQLEAILGPSICKVVTFNIQIKTRITIYNYLITILEWFNDNKTNLYYMNNKAIDNEYILIKYLQFIKTLKYIKYEEISIDGKYWQWFCERSKEYISYSLQLDKDKIIQGKELEKKRKEQLPELKKKIKNKHIPIDVSGPKDIYSFIRE
jgi:hypothetical protein